MQLGATETDKADANAISLSEKWRVGVEERIRCNDASNISELQPATPSL